ncbi:MAG TPA: tetratricopeptide repeat protein [Terriglobales bacterium]|nr:tetratricopeptide repeat protein [Terriglobales bacterium]
MECGRQLDTVGGASAGRRLIGLATSLLLICWSLPGQEQSPPPNAGRLASIRQLLAQERWQEIVDQLEPVLPAAEPAELVELHYYYGIASARLGRWQDARKAFRAGYDLQPFDKRFPIELAGVDFKQKRYPQAAAWLRQALRLDPNDSYANEFLGTVYFLQGNLEAALKYWNRVGKPNIENVRVAPHLRIKPAVLDRAFAFSPASTLWLPDLLTSEAQVQNLEIFPRYAFQLAAREDGHFDLDFHAQERNGWGRNAWEGLLSLFRGIFQQTIHPEFFNLGQSANNVVSLVRWDAQKRRALVAVSGPLRGDPQWRYHVAVDLRNENWGIRDSFTGPAPVRGALNLRREAISAGVTSVNSGRWSWSTGAEFSHRDYRSVFAGSALTPQILLEGNQLKHQAQVNYELLRVPERRFVARASASSQAGRIWSEPAQSFFKLQSSLTGHWFPQSQGDDFEMYARIGGGKAFGETPFDELFMLGLERDNDLWLRAHIGTRDGRKGSAPLGREYFLLNWELDKNIYSGSLFGVKLGPFLDTGKIMDPSPGLGSRKWLWDTGVQAKVFAFGVGVIFSYGKDLRSGNNAFYFRIGR